MEYENEFQVRRAKEEDVSIIDKYITKWLNFDVSREASLRRAVKNKELLVTDYKRKLVGFIHYVMHEDVIDGGPNSFITAFYVAPEYRNKGAGSRLLQAAIADALERGALGVEASTANPDARRLYERHHSEQFMGKWDMREIFLELNIPKYRHSFGQKSVETSKIG